MSAQDPFANWPGDSPGAPDHTTTPLEPGHKQEGSAPTVVGREPGDPWDWGDESTAAPPGQAREGGEPEGEQAQAEVEDRQSLASLRGDGDEQRVASVRAPTTTYKLIALDMALKRAQDAATRLEAAADRWEAMIERTSFLMMRRAIQDQLAFVERLMTKRTYEKFPGVRQNILAAIRKVQAERAKEEREAEVVEKKREALQAEQERQALQAEEETV